MEFNLTPEDINTILSCTSPVFPKYTTQLMNIANQNSHGTRKNVVGQLSDLFAEFDNEYDETTTEAWEAWYSQKRPTAIDDATEKIYCHIQKLAEALSQIDKEMIKSWAKDLIINKTFTGLSIQKAILMYLAQKRHAVFTPAADKDESKNIDGYLDNVPYSVKPISFSEMKSLPIHIEPTMIYYAKTKGGIRVKVEE